ncbi:MAG: Rpn family recombination-promoting nuclease/putative transposase [Bacteroidales bacterium]|nr:Rpn family recombination-promoting nuclease/putative transposase [Bacteroidales bacterium]
MEKQNELEEQKTEQSGNVKESTIYINPKTDFGFKRLFMEGLKAKIRLLDLLKTFFPEQLQGASRVVLDSTELLGDIEREKRVVLDILATLDDKTETLIEMQRANTLVFTSRSIFYTCRLVSKSLNRGDQYNKMPTVIGLFITEETLPEFADLEGFFHTVQLRRMDGKNFSEKIILGYLDLSKFAALNPGQMKDMQFSDRQEKWGYTLANVGQMELQDLSQEDEVFRSVFEDSMHQKLTEMEKEEYKKSVLEYEDVQAAVQYAREQGLEQGLARGLEQGLEQGREQGREEGRAVEKRQLARNMLAKGLAPDLVAEISGLSAREVVSMMQ